MTTVGYGDTFPVTPAGRGIAAFLMLTGIALFGMLTANITTFFVERGDQDSDAVEDVKADDHLTARLDELLRRIDTLVVCLPFGMGGSRPGSPGHRLESTLANAATG